MGQAEGEEEIQGLQVGLVHDASKTREGMEQRTQGQDCGLVL